MLGEWHLFAADRRSCCCCKRPSVQLPRLDVAFNLHSASPVRCQLSKPPDTQPRLVCCTTGLVSQWKDENSRLRPAVKTKISRQKAALDNALQKAQEELRVIGKRLIEPHAAGIKQQMAAGLAGLRQKAESALQELLHDVSMLDCCD